MRTYPWPFFCIVIFVWQVTVTWVPGSGPLSVIANESGVSFALIEEKSPEDVLEYYKRTFVSEDYPLRTKCMEVLLERNDTAGIELILETYFDKIGIEQESASYANRPLFTHAKEGLIPYLYEPAFYGTYEQGFREEVNLVVLGIIERSNRFPTETKRWASIVRKMLAVQGYKYAASVYSQSQDWLYHNRIAILEERYEQATWLPAQLPESNEEYKSKPPPLRGSHSSPRLTKLVKAPAAEVGPPSKALLIPVSDFFPAKSREAKRPDHPPSKVDTAGPGRVSRTVWLLGILLVLGTLSWTALRKQRLRTR